MRNIILYCVTIFLLSGCVPHSSTVKNETKILRIKGSDSMFLLVQKWADEFMRLHKDVSLYVEGGGSRSGIKALIDGTIDICATSRPLTSEEVQMLAKEHRSIGVSIFGAKDALGIFVHQTNPVSNLSLEQLKKIFTGEIINWKEVGGYDSPITIYSREPNSGTYMYFEDHILLGEQYSSNCIVALGTKNLIESVSKDSFSIGYGTFVYANNVKLLSINGISQTTENVRNGTYPISRYLYFYTVNIPEGSQKSFLDWIVSPEGQKIVKEIGYVPLYESE